MFESKFIKQVEAIQPLAQIHVKLIKFSKCIICFGPDFSYRPLLPIQDGPARIGAFSAFNTRPESQIDTLMQKATSNCFNKQCLLNTVMEY